MLGDNNHQRGKATKIIKNYKFVIYIVLVVELLLSNEGYLIRNIPFTSFLYRNRIVLSFFKRSQIFFRSFDNS